MTTIYQLTMTDTVTGDVLTDELFASVEVALAAGHDVARDVACDYNLQVTWAADPFGGYGWTHYHTSVTITPRQLH